MLTRPLLLEMAPLDIVEVPRDRPREISNSIQQLQEKRDAVLQECFRSICFEKHSPEELALIKDRSWEVLQSIENQRKELEVENGPGFGFPGKTTTDREFTITANALALKNFWWRRGTYHILKSRHESKSSIVNRVVRFIGRILSHSPEKV